MSEQGISICIFSVIVAVLAVVLVWLGEKQEKKEKEKKNGDGEKPVADSEEESGSGESVRYVRLTDGGKELARAARRGNNRRSGRKACSENNGVDIDD